MKKYTVKAIKNLVLSGAATDITNYNFDKMNEFLKSHTLERIGVSCGIYGINASLLQDANTGNYYAITARNSTLLMAF